MTLIPGENVIRPIIEIASKKLACRSFVGNAFPQFKAYQDAIESAGYGIDKILRWEKLTKQAVNFETSILYSTITYHLPKGGQKSG